MWRRINPSDVPTPKIPRWTHSTHFPTLRLELFVGTMIPIVFSRALMLQPPIFIKLSEREMTMSRKITYNLATHGSKMTPTHWDLYILLKGRLCGDMAMKIMGLYLEHECVFETTSVEWVRFFPFLVRHRGESWVEERIYMS